MRDTTVVYNRFLNARASSSSSSSSSSAAQAATIWMKALAWVLGIDIDLQERPKEGLDLDTLEPSTAISLWRVDMTDEQDPSVEPGERWWLLEVPPRDHPDGTRTELWSAFLSDAQFHELCECVDAFRFGDRVSGGARGGARGAARTGGVA